MKKIFVLVLLVLLMTGISYADHDDSLNETEVDHLICDPVPVPLCEPGTEIITLFGDNDCIEAYECRQPDAVCIDVPIPACDIGTELITYYDSNDCVKVSA